MSVDTILIIADSKRTEDQTNSSEVLGQSGQLLCRLEISGGRCGNQAPTVIYDKLLRDSVLVITWLWILESLKFQLSCLL